MLKFSATVHATISPVWDGLCVLTAPPVETNPLKEGSRSSYEVYVIIAHPESFLAAAETARDRGKKGVEMVGCLLVRGLQR